MSLTVSAASPAPAFATPSLSPTIPEILAQNANAAAQDPASPAAPTDPAQGNNLDISV
jgi:hypothetical protein